MNLMLRIYVFEIIQHSVLIIIEMVQFLNIRFLKHILNKTIEIALCQYKFYEIIDPFFLLIGYVSLTYFFYKFLILRIH